MALLVALARLASPWNPVRNARSLVKLRGSSSTSVFDGFRMLAAAWVMLSHVCINLAIVFSYSLNSSTQMYSTFWARVCFNGSLGVDMFFIVSGYLIYTQLSSGLAACSNERTWLLWLRSVGTVVLRFYARRLLRIVPAYAVIIGVWYLVVKFGTDPIAVQQALYCQLNWWQNVLFINNWWSGNTCAGWTWSIAIEMQLYFFSPLIVGLALLAKNPVWRFVLLAVPGAASLAAWIWISAPTAFYGDLSALATVYYLTYTRAFPYLFGMLAASIVEHEAKGNLRRPTVTFVNEIASPSSESTVELQHMVVILPPSDGAVTSDDKLDQVPIADDRTPLAVATKSVNAESNSTAHPTLHRVLPVYLPRFVSSVLTLSVAVCFVPQSEDDGLISAGKPANLIYFQAVMLRPLFCVAFAYVLYDLASVRCAGDRYHQLVTSILTSAPFRILGQLSYSTYLAQFIFLYVYYVKLVIPAIYVGLVVYNEAWMVPVFFLVVYATTVASAVGSFFLVEKPFINISHALFSPARE